MFLGSYYSNAGVILNKTISCLVFTNNHISVFVSLKNGNLFSFPLCVKIQNKTDDFPFQRGFSLSLIMGLY
jgi:hypothetical protein